MRILTALALLAAGAGTAAAIFMGAQHLAARDEGDRPPLATPALPGDAQERRSLFQPSSDFSDVVFATGSIAAAAPAAAADGVAPAIDGPLLRVTREADSIRVSGAVGDLGALDDFRAAAREAAPTAALETALRGDPELDADIAQAGLAAIAALSRLATGEARVEDGALAVEGEALYPGAGEAIRERVAALIPAGWRVEVAVSEPEERAAGPDCDARLGAALAEGPIAFAVASSRIDDGSLPTIDRVAQVLAEDCADLSVEIGGHTDSDGPETANARISQARADAVRDALAARGVDAGRLAAVGYGEARPVAPNDTPENKALNRRIEIVVQR